MIAKAPLPPRPGSGLPLTPAPPERVKGTDETKVLEVLAGIDAVEFDENSDKVLTGRMNLWNERAPS